MKVIKKRFTIPEYREKKEIYEIIGYEELSYKEKGVNAYVSLGIDEDKIYVKEAKKLEKHIYSRGIPFLPIILLFLGAFVFLANFIIALAIAIKDKVPFELEAYALGFLFPSFACVVACGIYTYFYFRINKWILSNQIKDKEEIIRRAKLIRKNIE